MRRLQAIIAAALLASVGGACDVGSAPGTSPASPHAQAPTAVPTADAGLDANGCPIEELAILRELQAVDHTLVIGDGLEIPDGTISVSSQNGRWNTSDSVPTWAGLDIAMPPLVLDRGTSLAVRERSVDLLSLAATARPHAGFTAVDGALPTYAGPAPQELAVTVGDPFEVTLPDIAGRWVVELQHQWQTSCFEGAGFTYVVVQTR